MAAVNNEKSKLDAQNAGLSAEVAELALAAAQLCERTRSPCTAMHARFTEG